MSAQVLAKLAGLLRAGIPLGSALVRVQGELPADQVLSFLLDCAKQSGSGAVAELLHLAERYRWVEAAQQRVALAHLAPRSTARMVLWLPVVSAVTAQILGLNIAVTVQQQPVLILSIATGALLLLLSNFLIGKMLAAAKPKPITSGWLLIAVAMQLRSGRNFAAAQSSALTLYEKHFASSPSDAELAALAQVEKLVTQTGSQAVEILRSESERLQSNESFIAEARIEKLGVRLMLPLGLVVLPAFVLLAIVPLGATLLRAGAT